MDWVKKSARLWSRGGTVGLAVVLATVFGLFEGVERRALNMQFHLRGPIAPKTPIVIVSIDEESFDELDLQWPWPRALHGKFLDAVSRGKPAAIGLDIVFSEPSSRGSADDRALGLAIGRAGNVVLAAAITAVKTPLYTKEDLNPPIPVIREGAAAFGFVNFVPEEDAFVRSASLTCPYLGKTLEGFDLHLYELGVKAGISAQPLPGNDTFLINYRGGPKTFPTIPYYQVLNGEVDPDLFTGKIVLVGATSPILHDLFPTPFAPHGEMPGVEIHANVLETLFQGIPLRRAPRPLSIVSIMVGGLLAVWLTDRMRPLVAFGVIMALAVAYAGTTFVTFAWGRFWLDIAPVPAVLVLGYGTMVVENFIREQREKRRLSRFFSPAVVKEIIRHKDEVKLGSTRRRMTVLFSDIRGFTPMSEKLSPEEVVAFLREYLTVMTEAVFQHGGTVDKYIGDAIMALYNVPFDQPDHAAQAVRTGLAFQERLQPIADRFRDRYGADLQCGVGIHTGDAVVGTIGAEQRLKYTAIGDAINLASRLESITKDYKVPIVISESTFKQVEGQFLTRYLGEVRVKGKEIPIKIHAVAGASARKEDRIQVRASVTIYDDEVSFHLPVRDLSRGGVAVSNLATELPLGRVVPLYLNLASIGRGINVTAKVAWSLDENAGFQFLNLKPGDEATIEEFLAHSDLSPQATSDPSSQRPSEARD